MFTVKHLKLRLYKQLARFSRLYFYSLFFVAIITVPLVFWRTKIPLIPGSILNICFKVFVFAAFLMLLLLLVWGWYFVWFRYAAYGAAHVISLIRRVFKNILFQIVIILAVSAWFWVWRKRLFPGEEYKLREILMFSQAIKILVITAALFTIWRIFQSRKRIVILDFENYTGDDKLDPVVKGIASRLLNEMSRLSKLLKTYDDIHPDAEKKMAVLEPTMDVQDIGKDFEEIIGPGSGVKIGNVVTIPLRPIYGFFRKLLLGPLLTGGVHLKGEKLILTACLKGGKFKGNWQISCDDIENPPNSTSEQVIKLTDQLVCRVLTDMSQGISPRWKAMQCFIEGLRFFRETLRTEEKRKLNLIKAKDAFSLAVRDDEQFVQCYYNFGLIYRKLESDEAAKAAFRIALEKKPDYHQCYYQLALIYYNHSLDEKDMNLKKYALFDAQWFCQQAIAICPTDPYYWNLLAVIRYYLWENEDKMKKRLKNRTIDESKKQKDIPEEVFRTAAIGAVLAWRALCKSIIKAEKIQAFKDTAILCTRNLAVITGETSWWRSRCIFNQAIFLAPDNNDLHFEKGRYYYCYYSDYRKNKIIKAYKAFKRVFEDDKEVDDPFSYWAYYISVNARLYDKTGERQYKEVVENGFFHFLDAAAEIIQNKKEKPEDIESHEKQVSDALNFEEREYGFLVGLNDILNGNFTSIDDWRNRTIQKMEDYIYKWSLVFRKYFPGLSEGFLRWAAAQAEIKSAMLILDSGRNDDFPEVIYRLNLAKELLKEYNPNEFKILGLYRYLGEAFYQLNSHKDALEQAREAVRLSPYDPEVREVLGEIYFKLKDYSQAINEWQISFNLGKPKLNILEKIGDAYIKKGKVLRDPVKRKDLFNKAATFFEECHDIIKDKSYGNGRQEDVPYIETLRKTHFNRASFSCELQKYDDAISHYQKALEMAYALNNDTEILKILLEMGRVYIESHSLDEAEKAFKEAESNTGGNSAEVEIKLGIAISQVERVTVLNDEILSEESLRYLRDVKEGQETKNLIDIVTNTDEKSRLSALYHECRGRLYFKQEEFEDAEKEFEKSLSYRANPRVYYYLAELYGKIAGLNEGPLRNLCLAQTRSALSLCLRNDFQERYKKEVSELLDKLSAF